MVDQTAEPYARTALHHRQPIAAPDGAVAMAERPFVGKVTLRGNAKTIAAGLKTAIGTLPENGGITAGKAATVLATSPDEWLIVTDSTIAPLAARLTKSLGRKYHQLVDISDYYTTIRLEGVHARALLQKLSTHDLHPRQFKPMTGGGIILGHANPWIMLLGDDDGHAVFDIHVRWSHADYLWCLIAKAGGDWALPAQEPRHGERLVI